MDGGGSADEKRERRCGDHRRIPANDLPIHARAMPPPTGQSQLNNGSSKSFVDLASQVPQIMSSRSVSTSIIGPRGLLRDSLASLLGAYSYRVIESHETAAEIAHPPEEEEPGMVLLVVRTVGVALAEAGLARRICPKCKIVALLEDIPRDCFWKLARSNIDGCVPLHVSRDFLIRTLDLVMSDAAQIIVLADDRALSTSPTSDGPQRTEGTIPRTDRIQLEGTSTGIADEKPAIAPKSKVAGAFTTVSDAGPRSSARPRLILATSKPEGDSQDAAPQVDGPERSSSRSEPLIDAVVSMLSKRQRQIIDGLVKGQPNKTIARVCGITEATVKVHMKAILRKVSCSNRTQVAIWAVENARLLRPGKPAAADAEERRAG